MKFRQRIVLLLLLSNCFLFSKQKLNNGASLNVLKTI